MSALVRTDDVRRQNTRLIMQALRRHKCASRTEIVSQTGLSAATVSTITSSLIADGILLSEDEPPPHGAEVVSRRGRPRVTLSLNPQVGCIVVMVLAVSSLSGSLQDYAGHVLIQEHDHFPTRTASISDLEHHLVRMVTRLMAQQGSQSMPLRYIALGVQGVVDAGAQTMLWSPVTTHLNLPLGEMLHQAFHVPVWVANDCNMIAEALQWLEPERFSGNFAAILLASGIGMGLMLKGQRFIGTRSSAAEFGHMVHIPGGALCRCGQRGCIEAYAGDYAIWRRVAGLSADSEPLDEVDSAAMEVLIVRAQTHDGIERQAYREAGQALGHGLRSLFALIDPVAVAFVGQGVRTFSLMEPEIRAALQNSGNMLAANEVSLSCHADAQALIQLGCAVIALQTIDHTFGE